MADLMRFFRPKPPAHAVEPGELHIYRSKGPRRIVVVTLFDVARQQHDEIIAKVGQTFSGFDKVVYVTDIPEFLHFRAVGAAFEYFPSLARQAQHGDALPWASYLQARWDLILAKWQPEHVLAYGVPIDRFLASASEVRA